MDAATHQIPATSANLGPGYDCLGVALQLYNTITVRRAETLDATHPMTREVSSIFFEKADRSPFSFSWSITGAVPMSRGLGSSVTVRLGILHGVNALCGSPLDAQTLYELCATLEGHPDNAAPAAFGGFTVAGSDRKFIRFEVDAALRFVLFVPDQQMLTAEARKVIPQQITHRDATRNTANACRITAAFATKNYALLRNAFEDFLHQPYRAPLLPCLPAVIHAGTAAGAIGGFLSGSGSCIACVTLDTPQQVADAMQQAAGISGKTLILQPDNRGAQSV